MKENKSEAAELYAVPVWQMENHMSASLLSKQLF